MEKEKISADLLAYNPNLKFDKKIELDIEEIYKSEITPTGDNSNKSVILQSFESLLPSSIISNLLDLKNIININLDAMREELSDSLYAQKYFASTDDNEKESIKGTNSNDIYGSTKFESYIELEKVGNEVSELKKEFSIAVYSKDIDDIESKEIDEASLNRLSLYEKEEEYEKVNYFSLYNDVQICYLLEEYCFKIEEITRDLFSIEDESKESKINDSTVSMFEKKFFSINKMLNFDIHKDSSNKDTLINSLYNLYITKQDLNLFMETFASMYSISDYEIFEEIKEDNVKEMKDRIIDFLKSSMYSTLAKEDIVKTLENKAKIRGFFA